MASDVLERMRVRAGSLGLAAAVDRDVLTGSRETLLSKWLLGGRKAVYRMSASASEGEHAVHFREMVVETSYGLPPPGLSVEKTKVRGTRLTGSRAEHAIGSEGQVDYGAVREALEREATEAGWQFVLEAGQPPAGSADRGRIKIGFGGGSDSLMDS